LKIAFDEHVPAGLVRMFKSLADERRIRRTVGATGGPGHPGGIEVVLAKDYAPSPTDDDFVHGSDVPWMERFAADGGTAIISGNTKMLTVPRELLAIQRLGLTSVFFEENWNGWDFFQKCSLLLWHWTAIVAAIRAAKPATLLRVPSEWREARRVLRIRSPGQLRAQKSKPTPPKPPSSPSRKARRKMRQALPGQGALDLRTRDKGSRVRELFLSHAKPASRG
jgi:hypothetical protein